MKNADEVETSGRRMIVSGGTLFPRIGRWLFVICLVFLALGSSRLTVEAALLRNIGHRELMVQITQHDGSCTDIPLNTAMQYLTRAMSLQPNVVSSWRTLLRVKGLTDRQWIVEQVGSRWNQLAGGSLKPIELATEALMPPRWAMQDQWSTYRCLAARGAWTLGLVDTTLGQWERAVAAYQAGIGLAPGRVPADIIKEYYWALARYNLAAADIPPTRQLTAAKYLALAGEVDEASRQFRAMAQDERLSPEKRCEAIRGLTWLKSGEEAADGIPPWPVSYSNDGLCTEVTEPEPPTIPGWSPQWTIPPDAMTNAKYTNTLLGFDIDLDVLEAGAEVIGTLYWRTPDGGIELQGFRQPNLWPNSGNTWLRLDGFSTCLLGYVEPPWVPPCASNVFYAPADEERRNPVGHLHVPPGEGPDTYVATASVPIPKGRMIVYGGWWRIEGNFQRAQVARYGGDQSDPRTYYEVVISLSSLPRGIWQKKVGITSPLPWDYDFNEWVRPRVGQGEGELQFDDVFSFVFPVR